LARNSINRVTRPRAQSRRPKASEGYEGWDDYAPFYDWENARTLGKRDVPFWRNLALHCGGPVLELGCGTGRIALPLGRAGVPLVGIDRSSPMLERARVRVRRARLASRVHLIRGDIRFLPFPSAAQDRAPQSRRGHQSLAAGEGGFAMVLAPYGLLQSLLRDRDLTTTLTEIRRVLQPGGTFGIELVADLPAWKEYRQRVSLKGWRNRPGGSHVTLVETVRQDRARRLTIFDQEFTERRGARRRVHRFALTFRTVSVPQMARRLERAGFEVTALLGDYRGGPWDARADIWVILARNPSSQTAKVKDALAHVVE
jgi:ubiquinone/menaquinone biosynthesis C-methylase UbiE